MMDFWFTMLVMAFVILLSVASWKVPMLGLIGLIIGVVTLYPVALDGEVRWGYLYNGTAVQQLTSVEPQIQMLSIIVIFICLALTLGGIVNKLK